MRHQRQTSCPRVPDGYPCSSYGFRRSAAHHESRSAIVGLISFEHARKHQLQEIVSQQSSVLLNQGILEHVAGTTLCITRPGQMLVQVGKWKGKHLVPACQLPGGKLQQDETWSSSSIALRSRMHSRSGVEGLVQGWRSSRRQFFSTVTDASAVAD